MGVGVYGSIEWYPGAGRLVSWSAHRQFTLSSLSTELFSSLRIINNDHGNTDTGSSGYDDIDGDAEAASHLGNPILCS